MPNVTDKVIRNGLEYAGPLLNIPLRFIYVTSFSSMSYCSNLRLISNMNIEFYFTMDDRITLSLGTSLVGIQLWKEFNAQ